MDASFPDMNSFDRFRPAPKRIPNHCLAVASRIITGQIGRSAAGQTPDVFPNLCLRGKWLAQRIASASYGRKLNHEGVPGDFTAGALLIKER
jgi:hypothetical protein